MTVPAIEACWSLFAREPVARVERARWAQQARTFFDAELTVVGELPGGEDLLERATLEVDVASRTARARLADGTTQLSPTRVRVTTMPLADAPEARAAADRAVDAIGGAGFELLIPRATRLWLVEEEVAVGGDARAPLVVAAVVASVLLAPILPPGGGAIFGVRGARLRLEERGWPGQSPA